MSRALVFSAALAMPGLALAQPAIDYLPPTPDVAPERDVAAPDLPPEPGPVQPAADTGLPRVALGGIVLDGATAVPQAELAPLWDDLIGTAVTLEQLEEVAARIGAAYRARGFLLSQALVPAQTVSGGIVHITVLEGFVDQVEISGAAPSQQVAAERFFAPVPGERPLRLSTLERSVLLARDTFGPSVETVLEPSPVTFAAADLGVAVAPEPTAWFGSIDNRGSRLFGAWTASGGTRSYDLLGLDERLDSLFALAPDGAGLAYGAVTLDMPIAGLGGTWLDGARLALDADISRSDPDLARSGQPEDLTVTADQTDLRAGIVVPFIRSRSRNLFGRAGLTWRGATSVTDFAGVESWETDRLAILDAQLTFDAADSFGGISLVDMVIRQGLDIFGAEVGAVGPAAGDPTFTLFAGTLSRLQRIGQSSWSVYGEAIGQYAAEVLPDSERFALGNSTIGRGFAPGNTTGDSGYGARLELRRTVADGEGGAEFYAFGDYGQAYDRTGERDGEQWQTLASYGIGANIDVTPWLTVTPEIARQADGVPTDTTDPDLETRFFIGAIARF